VVEAMAPCRGCEALVENGNPVHEIDGGWIEPSGSKGFEDGEGEQDVACVLLCGVEIFRGEGARFRQ
jgi:hypothetical protein